MLVIKNAAFLVYHIDVIFFSFLFPFLFYFNYSFFFLVSFFPFIHSSIPINFYFSFSFSFSFSFLFLLFLFFCAFFIFVFVFFFFWFTPFFVFQIYSVFILFIFMSISIPMSIALCTRRSRLFFPNAKIYVYHHPFQLCVCVCVCVIEQVTRGGPLSLLWSALLVQLQASYALSVCEVWGVSCLEVSHHRHSRSLPSMMTTWTLGPEVTSSPCHTSHIHSARCSFRIIYFAHYFLFGSACFVPLSKTCGASLLLLLCCFRLLFWIVSSIHLLA